MRQAANPGNITDKVVDDGSVALGEPRRAAPRGKMREPGRWMERVIRKSCASIFAEGWILVANPYAVPCDKEDRSSKRQAFDSERGQQLSRNTTLRAPRSSRDFEGG